VSAHTPEPWGAYGGEAMAGDVALLAGRYLTPRGQVLPATANVRRAVRCVNACAGMEDPAETIARLLAALEQSREEMRVLSALLDAARGAP